MNPNEASANKTINITQLGTTTISIPSSPSGSNGTKGKLVLIRIIVNKKGASSNTATIYDDTGANPDNIKGILDTTANVGSIEYGFPMYNGIVIVTATGTAADLTIVYSETP